LETTFRKLGVERLTKDDVQRMQWEALEAKIGNWIHYMRIAVRILLPDRDSNISMSFFNKAILGSLQVKLLLSEEKKICDEIFKDIESIRVLCFAEATSNSMGMLLSFGDAIARSKRSPEKLFVLLDMYEIMRELQPEVRHANQILLTIFFFNTGSLLLSWSISMQNCWPTFDRTGSQAFPFGTV